MAILVSWFTLMAMLSSLPKPRYWAIQKVVEEFGQSKNGDREWCLGYRDVTNVNNERTAIATVLPSVGFVQPLNGISCSNAITAAVVLASINSLVCDFVARLRFTGRHLNVTNVLTTTNPDMDRRELRYFSRDRACIYGSVFETVRRGMWLRGKPISVGQSKACAFEM